jgi:hypothetical protein
LLYRLSSGLFLQAFNVLLNFNSFILGVTACPPEKANGPTATAAAKQACGNYTCGSASTFGDIATATSC